MSASAARFVDYARDPVDLAQLLLGQRLVRVMDGERLSGIIVETEAYLGAADRAAHTYNGRRTQRNESMYLGPGHAYVYFTYGMHYCMNVVCGKVNEGVAVLLRALEPVEGIEQMFANRPAASSILHLCSGPAKLTQALRITREQDGTNLMTSSDLFIERLRSRRLPQMRIEATSRIGVHYAEEWAHRPLRFVMRGNPHASK